MTEEKPRKIISLYREQVNTKEDGVRSSPDLSNKN